MQRRRVLTLLTAGGLSSVSGCLDGLVESVEFIDNPGAVDGEWTPTQISDPAEHLANHRENAESLAFLQVAMTGCDDPDNSIATTPLTPLNTDATRSHIEVATATDRHAAAPFKDLLADCTPTASDHEPYLESPTELVDNTHFEYAYLLALTSKTPLSLDVDFAGTLPGNLAYIEVSVRPGESNTTVFVRVGAWVDPEGILIGISNAGTEVPTGVYEPTSRVA